MWVQGAAQSLLLSTVRSLRRLRNQLGSCDVHQLDDLQGSTESVMLYMRHTETSPV